MSLDLRNGPACRSQPPHSPDSLHMLHIFIYIFRCSLPKAMSISRSEILRKQQYKVSYRCSLQKRSEDLKPEREHEEALCNPWISSAMVMAMSIYRTLCVLVQLRSLFSFFLKISLLEMLFDLPLTSHDIPLTSYDLLWFFQLRSLFFFLKISLLEMLIAFGNEHLKIMGLP